MLVSATSTPVTVARKKVVEDDENPRSKLAQVPYIRYLINIRIKSVLAIFDLGSKVNIVYPAFIKELGFPNRLSDVEAHKIDSTTLDIYEIVIVALSATEKANQVKFFEKLFLVANVKPEVVLEMPFFTLSSANDDFLD